MRALHGMGQSVAFERRTEPAILRGRPREPGPCPMGSFAFRDVLPPAGIDALEQRSCRIDLRARQFLLREGDAPRHLFVVTSGALRRFRYLADGRRLVGGFLLPGDFIGISALPRYRHSIQAIEDALLCALPLAGMREIFENHPGLERELIASAGAELEATHDRLMALARMRPLERLASFLIDMAVRQGRKERGTVVLALPMSRTDIADHLGLTVETVSRSFTRLRLRRIIAFDDPREVELLEPETLRRLAGAGC